MHTIHRHFTIGFIGLGLIGGSIAKATKRVFPNYTMIAYDTDKEALAMALDDKIISKAVDQVGMEFSQCDYIFLCTPVHYNIEYLAILKPIIKESCILTDVGSVKNDIYNAIETIGLSHQFIGGHPMVGSEKSGYSASKEHLLENAYYFITPSETVSEKAIDEFMMFIDELGALTLLFSPVEHDRAASAISHVPHIIASSLVNLVKDNDYDDGILKKLAAGGFKDITRIASSSPTVWQHICMSNPDNIIDQLDQFITSLDSLKMAISNGQEDKLLNFFTTARDYRDSVPDSGVGVIRRSFEIYVDLIDQPGALAAITTILAANSISIKNIGIINNREFEEGVLKIVLYDDESAKKARKVMKNYNYEVYER